MQCHSIFIFNLSLGQTKTQSVLVGIQNALVMRITCLALSDVIINMEQVDFGAAATILAISDPFCITEMAVFGAMSAISLYVVMALSATATIHRAGRVQMYS